MDCDCGHPAGHHDDEPAGCWDCDCEAWHVTQAPDALERGWWEFGTHPEQAPCLDCGGKFMTGRCTARTDGSHRYPPFPGKPIGE